ncbi:MAG TPA: phosphoenolpyruvate carboxykinase (ATP) [Thermoanaerobaculia bacterium]|nr:phosphoenolpyruvate carboxykinase (ATP) [Thermoanaerobaculia bacterium]
MEQLGAFPSRHGLDGHGLHHLRRVFWNLSPAHLYEHAISRGEGRLTSAGTLVALTGSHTGRSPNDKFLAREPGSEHDIWWGKVNRPLDGAQVDRLHMKIGDYLAGKDVFVFQGYAGADPAHRLPVRVISEYAWHSLCAHNMCLRERGGEALAAFAPGFTVIDAPGCAADPAKDGTRSGTFIVLDFGRRMVLIGGTEYAGEIKKSIFSVMNYLLPKQEVFSMHCSCNYGRDRDDVALFFGLSGTGKTTLSADPERTLIGDDEHGWGKNGVFNVEGGCYAKVIRLSAEGEPEIWAASHRFGTLLENVVLDEQTREVDFEAATLTENTRASYPLTLLDKVDLGGQAGHPKHVVFLTCDAFGVLPPIARLTPEQAMYHFLSGYTAKVAGTERGVTEPAVTFSTCFGAPFLPLHPSVYARLLGARLQQHRAGVWLVNTGWTGGPYGTGSRIKLRYTRRMIHAAFAGELANVPTRTDAVFGLEVPTRIEGVPAELLEPRRTWADAAAYDAQAAKLAEMFVKNFAEYESQVAPGVVEAGPRVVRAST